MKLLIMGIDGNIIFERGDVIQLVVHNKVLFKQLSYDLEGYCDVKNDYVILDEKDEREDQKMIYINDLVGYEVDNKLIVDHLLKEKLTPNENLLADRNYHEELYNKLTSSIINEMNLLEVDYLYKMEFDLKNIVKILGIDFTPINSLEPVLKIEEIIRLYSTVFHKRTFLVKNGLQYLSVEDYKNIENYVCNLQVNLIFFDYLDEGGVVATNNLYISEDLAAYKIHFG